MAILFKNPAYSVQKPVFGIPVSFGAKRYPKISPAPCHSHGKKIKFKELLSYKSLA
jgi:hypothetical protein